MKLLFDQNLSYRLCSRLADLFPDSTHVQLHGLDQADDSEVREFALRLDHVIVTLDADFADMATVLGHPPKVIWLRCGNQPTAFIESLLRSQAAAIQQFGGDPDAAYLEVRHLDLV